MTMRKRPAIIDSLEARHMFDSLTAGVTVATSVTTRSTQKNWSINLVAGQAIIVAGGETGTSAFQPQLILITPKHKALARSVGDSGAFISRIAPISGTYVVRIRDTDGTHFSGVTVTAAFTGSSPIVDGDDASTEQSGRRFAATISAGDLDVWRIPASGKQFLSVVANENTNGSSVGIGVAILGPDGAGVTAKESETGFAIDVPNVKAGNYYAVAYEPGANATGRYGIAFGLTPGVQTTEDPDTQTPLVSGATRTGDLPSGDIDLFQQTLAAGKTLTVTLARNGSSVTPAILLIDPNGNQVATTSGTSTTLTYKTTIAGTYSILTRNRDADTGGSYKLTYTVA
ncbi:MAG: hypothetical protein JWM57_798 [Phycisphaerales bacterium]|nr:hypothetical protein [Phycisphaerales bacterium]